MNKLVITEAQINAWKDAWEDAQAQASNKCKQCGNDNDLMTAFTKYQICGKCTRANHKRATKGR